MVFNKLKSYFVTNNSVDYNEINSYDNIILNAESTNIFKNRLDRFWVNQEFKFDWHADIAGIGSRSLNRLS